MTPFRIPPRPNKRAGVTLTEILMALLVMGIGLVSVATLFPLSLLRSVEATKLTNATLTRINAQARLEASINARLDPNTGAFTGQVIRRAIVEDPDRDGNPRNNDGNFVFDPLGAAVHGGDGSPLAAAFGWIDKNGNGQPDGATELSAVARYTFGYGPATTPSAAEFVTSPDSYLMLADVFGGAVGVSGTTLTVNGPDLSEYVGQTARVTFIHPSGNTSEVRAGSIASGTQVTLSGGLPTGYEIGRVTIEIPERRYTWLATVRRVTWRSEPSVTIVVFFRRSFSPEDERVYSVIEPPGGYNEFELHTGGAAVPPGFQVGGWMFDMNAFRWLKIASIEKIGGSEFDFRFTTDPEEEDALFAGRPGGFAAVFPRNVVEAYMLKKE